MPDQLSDALSRFRATPAEINAFLLQHLAEDTLLRYQQAIGNRAAEEAAKDLRMEHAAREADVEWTNAADHIDPLKGGGHYPSALITWPASDRACGCSARFERHADGCPTAAPKPPITMRDAFTAVARQILADEAAEKQAANPAAPSA